MKAPLKRLWQDRRGNALVIAAAALPLVVGSAGFATDTVQWALWKRQLQRAADSGALAGVHTIVRDAGDRGHVSPTVRRDLDLNNRAEPITTGWAAGQPSSGPYASDPYAVHVVLTARKELAFSSLFLAIPPTITARATATVVATGKYCVISLEPTTTTGITYQGNATVDLGCGMATNSRGASAINATGSSTIVATPISAVGGIPASGSFAEGTTLQPYSMVQKDPFADVPPTTAGCPGPNVNVNTTQTVTLNPGCFGGMTLNGTVTLNPGTYILDGGGLRIGSQARVSCNGCVFVLTSRTADTNPGSIGNVDINGGATVNLSAPTTGTYAGILFYQDRRALDSTSANHRSLINGNSSSSYQGALYFPAQEMTFNGTSGMNTQCVQMVAMRVMFSGNTTITNSCPTNSGALAFDGSMIRLVE